MNLAMYTITNIKFCEKKEVTESRQGIIIEVFLGRPLMGNILTEFFPTILFVIIR